jgi:hypothetical protein
MKKIDGWAWFKRRMNDPEILSHIKDIVEEGFDYNEPCEFVNQFDTYLGTVVYGSALTFINSYEELYDVRPPVEEYIYDFIESKFREFIKKNYDYWISECEENMIESKNIVGIDMNNFKIKNIIRRVISEETKGIPPYFKRRFNSDEFERILKITLGYWINQRGQNRRAFLLNVINESIYGFFMAYHNQNPFDKNIADVYLFEDFIHDRYGEYINTYYIDNY